MHPPLISRNLFLCFTMPCFSHMGGMLVLFLCFTMPCFSHMGGILVNSGRAGGRHRGVARELCMQDVLFVLAGGEGGGGGRRGGGGGWGGV